MMEDGNDFDDVSELQELRVSRNPRQFLTIAGQRFETFNPIHSLTKALRFCLNVNGVVIVAFHLLYSVPINPSSHADPV